uniref:methylenetetrahydrofolate reductase (NADPH) n=1 Tax=Panagrellus redivivus TaxID=6233 RepID=A0A7E4VGY0_PANRE
MASVQPQTTDTLEPPTNGVNGATTNGTTNGFNRNLSTNSLKKLNSPIPYCGSTNDLPAYARSNSTLSRHSPDSAASVKASGDNLRECTEYVPLHKRIEKRISSGTPFFSLEFFPPKTANGVANFLTRIDRYRDGGPMFLDITWHLGSDPANIEKETSSSSIAAACLAYCRVDTMLHMTCAQYPKEQTLKHLQLAQNLGIRNLLALRGDLPINDSDPSIYPYRALDMIRWVRTHFGNYFTVCASGYPKGHPEAPSYAADIAYLKMKVDAGADFIITQLFFEAETFETFVADCRAAGITVPIIPGIMPIASYDSIRRVAELSKLTIPKHIMDTLESIRHDDEAVTKYGIHLAVEMCRRLLDSGVAPSLHMYTMNREHSCREVLQALGLWQHESIRSLPWLPHGGHHPLRCREDVRPIYWCARPKSYIFRTKDWDEYPNGRWGNSSSPAFNDLQEYYMFYLKGLPNKEAMLQMYSRELNGIEDVCRVFVKFLTQEPNEEGVKISKLPWNEQEFETSAETELIKDQLVWCNENAIFTINSQPSVNSAPSSDPLVGWGKPGGYCYQKAYLEFFISKARAIKLKAVLEQYPQVNYHVINKDASIDWSNSDPTMPIAVTWGVFPGCEIAQPTVVDPLSFRVWKDEAYDAWLNIWAALYPEESKSRKLLQDIHDDFCLVTLVDNDFVKPSVLFEILEQVISDENEAAVTFAASG